MAEPKIRCEHFVGPAPGPRSCGHLVGPDDRASWLDLHRSIHNSALLRALCDEQISSFRTLLLLSSGARFDGFIVDGVLDCGLCFGAPLGLAWCFATGSSARVRALLDRCSGDLFLAFPIKVDRIYFARDT